MSDIKPVDRHQAVGEVVEELCLAMSKHPPMHSPHEGIAVLQEEVDELWENIKANKSSADLRAEAKQVAAMAIRFMIDLT